MGDRARAAHPAAPALARLGVRLDGSLALLPIGYVLAGAICDAVGPAPPLLVGAGACALALAAGLIPHETRMLPRLAT